MVPFLRANPSNGTPSSVVKITPTAATCSARIPTKDSKKNLSFCLPKKKREEKKEQREGRKETGRNPKRNQGRVNERGVVPWYTAPKASAYYHDHVRSAFDISITRFRIEATSNSMSVLPPRLPTPFDPPYPPF